MESNLFRSLGGGSLVFLHICNEDFWVSFQAAPPWLGERGALWLSHDGFSAAFGLEFSIPQYPQEKPGMRTVRTPAELLWA
jgi:hypothetical protein